jgi:hypothetical protein
MAVESVIIIREIGKGDAEFYSVRSTIHEDGAVPWHWPDPQLTLYCICKMDLLLLFGTLLCPYPVFNVLAFAPNEKEEGALESGMKKNCLPY